LCCWWFDREVDSVVGALIEEWILFWWFAREVDWVVDGLLEKWIGLLVVC
jgi:hypothetical protein